MQHPDSSSSDASLPGAFHRPSARPPCWRLAVLWATGPDTTLDGVFRVQALRRAGAGWERFERTCSPFPDSAGDAEAATARMVREYGVDGSDLAGAPSAEEVFRELEAFLHGGPILTVERRGFEAWHAHLVGERTREAVFGLDELSALFLPGRRPAGGRAVLAPEDLRAALAQVVGRFLELDRTTLALAGAGFSAALAGLAESDSEGERRLDLALALVQHPSAWAGGTGELFALHPALADGRLPLPDEPALPLSGAAEVARTAVERLKPRCAEIALDWERFETVPVSAPSAMLEREPAAFPGALLTALDDVFAVHLPKVFSGADQEEVGAGPRYREGQHRVARAVAETLGERELLLVHAPTGTGKTLAYLVPALIWSAANEVRVGISTYTRTLQEQAMDIEVPRALAALRQAGVALEPRVTLLKGRANYLCWRALVLQAPGEMDGPATWLAWTALVLFARLDEDGDLDRFPRRAPLIGGLGGAADAAQRPFQAELDALVRAVRAGKGCCSASRDRETCGAETARMRAERSHLVITNHSFALARQSFFKRVIFDECEHLHDQAHAAFSHVLALESIRELLERLRQPGRPNSRAPLDRLERLMPPDVSAAATLERCRAAWLSALGALDGLQSAIDDFKAWREREHRGRDAREAHGLLREYVAAAEDEQRAEAAGARALLAARGALSTAATELGSALSALASEVESLPARGMPQLRRALELLQADLQAVLEGLEAWVPLEEGRPRFRRETFHAIEADARGRDVLAARVLLPNEFLGRFYYPELECAVLISATTWLRGSFDCARGYLGLDRAALPTEDEEREPCRVRTFRAPDPFDYRRVLVCVPDDAPAYREKRAFDAYVRAFVAYLGERTRGRLLVLFTNADDARRAGQELAGFFRARRIPFWFQNMPGHGKEELGLLFRERVDSILLGVDTFWYGADFPGETLEYLVIVKLPYGVPDAYHQAQCAALGEGEQRRRIYMPRALAKLRQGFGRLMRRESDRGSVFVLDGRVLDPRHAVFLRELPLAGGGSSGSEDEEWTEGGARFLRSGTEACIHAALAHMSMLTDVERRGLAEPFPWPRSAAAQPPAPRAGEIIDIPVQDVPF